MSGVLREPDFIFSSRVSISLSFFLKFLRRLTGSVAVFVGVEGARLVKLGSVISHLASLSAASSAPERVENTLIEEFLILK